MCDLSNGSLEGLHLQNEYTITEKILLEGKEAERFIDDIGTILKLEPINDGASNPLIWVATSGIQGECHVSWAPLNKSEPSGQGLAIFGIDGFLGTITTGQAIGVGNSGRSQTEDLDEVIVDPR